MCTVCIIAGADQLFPAQTPKHDSGLLGFFTIVRHVAKLVYKPHNYIIMKYVYITNEKREKSAPEKNRKIYLILFAYIKKKHLLCTMIKDFSINQLNKNIMKDLINIICLSCIIICIIGLIVSLAINNVATFTFSVLFMVAFWAIGLIDMIRK